MDKNTSLVHFTIRNSDRRVSFVADNIIAVFENDEGSYGESDGTNIHTQKEEFIVKENYQDVIDILEPLIV